MFRVILALSFVFSPWAFTDIYYGAYNDGGEAPNKWFSAARFNAGVFYHNDLHFFGEGDLFIPAFWSRNTLIFLDARGIDYSGSAFEGNFGVGIRRLFSDKYILGGYVFFDRKRSDYRNYFSQITLGAEWKTDKWSASINGYIPIGDTSKSLPHMNQVQLGDPDANGIQNIFYIDGMERALYGIDAEVGRAFGDLSVYLGYYFFDRSDVKSVTGPRLRVTYSIMDLFTRNRGNPWNDIMLEGAIHHDSPRGTQGYVGVRVFVYFGSTKGRKTTGVHARMLDYVRRDLDIVTLANEKAEFSPLMKLNGEPLKVQIATNQTELGQAVQNADVIGIDGAISVTSDIILQDGQSVTGGMYYFNTGMNDMGIQLAENGTLYRPSGGLFFVGKNNSFRDLNLYPDAASAGAFNNAIQNDPSKELSIGTLTVDNVNFFGNASTTQDYPVGVFVEIGDNSTDSMLSINNCRFDGMRDGILALTKNSSELKILKITNNEFSGIVNSGIFIQGKGSVPIDVRDITHNTFTSKIDSSLGILLVDLVNVYQISWNDMDFYSSSSRGMLFTFGSGSAHEINVSNLANNRITFGNGEANNRCVYVTTNGPFSPPSPAGSINLGVNGTVSNNIFEALSNSTGTSRGFSLAGSATGPGYVNVYVNADGKDLRAANTFFGMTTAEEVATASNVTMVPPLN